MTDNEDLTPGESKFYGVLWTITSLAAFDFVGWQVHTMTTSFFYVTAGDLVLFGFCVAVALFFAWLAWIFFQKS